MRSRLLPLVATAACILTADVRLQACECVGQRSTCEAAWLDAKTGKLLWKHDMFSSPTEKCIWEIKMAMWRSSSTSGMKKHLLANVMERSVYSTPITANGVMFIMTRSNIYAIQEGAQLRR